MNAVLFVGWSLFSAIALSSCLCSIPRESGRSASQIDAVLNSVVRYKREPVGADSADGVTTLKESMAHYGVPAVSIAAIDDDKIAWADAWGVLDVRTGARATTESLFEAASVTKMVVAAMVLHFVDQGRIDLDADVNNYLTSWKVPENEFAREHPVTLRLLLSHQAGLPTTNFPYEDDSVPTLVEVLRGVPPAENAAAVVEYVTGSRWQYSNLGYVIVQLLLEDVTGKSLQKLAEELIFDPLGMTSSSFVYPLSSEKQALEALPHDKDGVPHQASLHPTAMAQGGLLTTPSDIARLAIELMQAYRGNSARLFTQATAQIMFHPEVDLDPVIFGGVSVKEGLGVFLRIDGDTFSISHAGDNSPGATCWVTAFPQTGQGVVIATNGAGGLRYLTFEALAGFARAYGWPLSW